MTIARAIESVLCQSYRNFELLIFDDSSGDKTIQIIESYYRNNLGKINFCVASNNNGGPAFGRNWGLENASGKYICFLDADDYWFNNKLTVQVKFMESSGYEICSSNAMIKDLNTFPLLVVDYNLCQMINRNKVILSSCMLRLSFINVNKIYFNTSFDYISVEDYDFFLRIMLKKGKLRVLSDQLISYTVFSNSLSHENLLLNELRRINVLMNLKTSNLFLQIYKQSVIIIYKVYVEIRYNRRKL